MLKPDREGQKMNQDKNCRICGILFNTGSYYVREVCPSEECKKINASRKAAASKAKKQRPQCPPEH